MYLVLKNLLMEVENKKLYALELVYDEINISSYNIFIDQQTNLSALVLRPRQRRHTSVFLE